MTENDAPALAALVSDVLKYYRQPATDFILDVWWAGCCQFSLPEVQRALNAHVFDPDRGRFAPLVADVTRHLSGTAGDRAVQAWGKVYDAMGRVGAYTDVVFDDPAIHAVVNDMGGWPKLCRTENADLSHAQHRFIEFYKTISVRGAEGYPRMLSGDHSPDIDYERKGLPAPAPTLIGDPAQCAMVHAGGGDPRSQITALPPGAVIGDVLQRLPSGLSVRRLGAPTTAPE